MAHPLAWDKDGDPVELPETATRWRVRRVNPSGGPSAVNAHGEPLMIALEATADDLSEALGSVGERRAGRFRLDPVDDNGRIVSSTPCYCAVLGGGGGGGGGDALATIPAMARTNGDVVAAMTAQISTLVQAVAQLVAAVDSAGVSRRPLPPKPEMVKAEVVEIVKEQPSPWEPLVIALTPHIPTLVQAGFALLASRVNAASAASTVAS